MFDPVAMFWEDLSAQTTGHFPIPRVGHGFSSIGSILYVHGGVSMKGDITCCVQYHSIRRFEIWN